MIEAVSAPASPLEPSRRGEVLLLLFSVVFFLVLAEVAVRLTGAAQPRPSGYPRVDTDRRERRPINSRGYRDFERTLAKPPGVRRVVSLGDSFAWGVGVEFDDTYGQRVERTLCRRRRAPWQVVSLAQPGMNSVGEAAQLASEGLAYEPDVVALGYVLNDSEDENAAEARRVEDWLEDKREQKTRPLRFFDRSALYRMVSTRIWATLENRRRIAGYKSMYAADYPGWIAGQRALRTMGGLCRERGIPFVVLIFPLFGNPLDEGYPFPEIHAQVARAAAEAGAKVVDLLPRFRGLRWDILVVNGTEDEHPNEIAHRIAASALLKAIDEVVPGDPPRAAAP
jgi:hypothetical protein